jgi:hypothetical protein
VLMFSCIFFPKDWHLKYPNWWNCNLRRQS